MHLWKIFLRYKRCLAIAMASEIRNLDKREINIENMPDGINQADITTTNDGLDDFMVRIRIRGRNGRHRHIACDCDYEA